MKCPHCQTEIIRDATYCNSCGADLTAKPKDQASFTKTFDTMGEELTMGTIFAGRYQIIEELGRGGMGRAFRVLDKELDEEVVLKLIRPEIAIDHAVIERFKSEIKLARKIAHKNVGRVHELMEHSGTRFITMEYVAGEDLKSFIRRAGQLSSAKAADIACQIAEGLAAAHNLSIIHRDIKPQNIMIDRDGNAKILDFGIAKSLDAEGQTSPGAIVGTPGYMSPEQISGGRVDRRADLYSLGAILFEMLTGKEPFAGKTSLDVLLKQKSEEPPDPANLNPQIPAQLRTLILHCLEKEKENRCSSTEEFLSNLNQNAIKPTPKAAPSQKKERGTGATSFSPIKKRFLAALFFALLVVGYFLFFHNSRNLDTGISQARQAVVNSVGHPKG